MVDEVIQKVELLEISGFAPGHGDKSDKKNKEDIECFMQNSLMVIDNYEDLQGMMLNILAKLSVVIHKNFGLSCFNTLKELMLSS